MQQKIKALSSIGPWQLTKTIGKGSTGKVKLAVNSSTGEKRACKIIFAQEAESREPIGPTTSIRDIPGSKQDEHGKEFRIIREAAIMLLDLKIENILLDTSGSIKLIDFGLSNLYTPSSHLSTFCGSLYFAAPELLAARTYVGPEVDIWSMGIILYVLVCGHVPFDDNNMTVLHAKIRAGVVEYPGYLSNECKHLISIMLQPNPAQRCSMEDIRTSSWLTKGFDGPPDNYLPSRSFVEAINPEVVKRMKGFGFGTDQEVYNKLEEVLKGKAKIPLETMKSNSGFFQRIDVKSLGRALIHRNDKSGRIFTLPESSILSIYYLVLEKMEREYGKQQSPTSAPLSASSAKLDIPFDEDNVRSSFDDIPQVRRASMDDVRLFIVDDPRSDDDEERISESEGGAAIITSAPSSPSLRRISLDVAQESVAIARRIRPRAASMGELPPSFKEQRSFKELVGNNKIRMKRPRMKIPNRFKSSTVDISPVTHDEFDADQEPSSPGGKKLASNIVSAVKKRFSNFGGKSRSVQLDPLDALSSPPTSPTKDLLSDTEDSSRAQEERPRTLEDPPHRSRGKFNIKRSRDKPRLSKRISQKFQKGATEITDASDTKPNTDSSVRGGQVDSQVKYVFLKGLFSVATSSTKSASSIRKELLRVFELLNIEFLESHGVFECKFVDMADKADPSIGDGGKIVDNVKGDNWRSVVFEVYIVKIGWIAIHGVRFRRISGNIWQYKNICKSILDKLKL